MKQMKLLEEIALEDGTKACIDGICVYNSEKATVIGNVLLGNEKYRIGINIKETENISDQEMGYTVRGGIAIRVKTNAPQLKEFYLKKALGVL